MSLVNDLLPVATGLIGGGGALVKGIAFIREGQAGVKLRFGKAVRDKQGVPKVYGPGFQFMIPFVHSLVRRHVRQTALRSDLQHIMLADHTVFEVSTVVIFRVTNVYHALFEVDDLEGTIDDYCMSVLRDLLSVKTLEGIVHTEALAEELLAATKRQEASWGVEFISFRLTNCSPTPQTTELIQITATAERKVMALEAAAQKLDTSTSGLNPTVAAAIIGTPVAVSLGQQALRVSSTGSEHSPVEIDEV